MAGNAPAPPSTLKNTIAALSKVLDEAVRDELLATNPARSRAKRRTHHTQIHARRELPTLNEVRELAIACGRIDQAYGDFVLLSALLAARSSEVAGLVVGDIDWERRLVTIARQKFPGAGGLSTKPPKNRRTRTVPILTPLELTLHRLTAGRAHEAPLLQGPRGGTLTTGSICRATKWNQLVRELGYPDLRRYDLRHTGATWYANAGVPLHVVSDILGHTSIETTRSYLHTSGTELSLAAQRIERSLT